TDGLTDRQTDRRNELASPTRDAQPRPESALAGCGSTLVGGGRARAGGGGHAQRPHRISQPAGEPGDQLGNNPGGPGPFAWHGGARSGTFSLGSHVIVNLDGVEPGE